MKTNKIIQLPSKSPLKEIASGQGVLDLRIEAEKEIQGVGMGVLSDGTPFLTQRGLARLCGIQNAHIGTIGTEWNDSPVKPRIAKIRDLLATRGVVLDQPYISVMHSGTPHYAYPDSICVAVLEYYAFEAGPNCKEEAKANFRSLAGRALKDFIYSQIGYDPNAHVPNVWRQFHDRVSLTHNSVPPGYFSVFKEIADMIVTLGQHGLHIDHTFVPDGSVGSHWGRYWNETDGDSRHGARQQWHHNYPDYFPQARSNPQHAWCYPEEALPDFRRWMRENYIGDGKFTRYINDKVKQRALPPSFAQIVLAAYPAQ